jgi:Leucine-rich repeat (LRR) protein
MNKIILYSYFILFLGIARAQVVSIPDANFKAALISQGVDRNENNEIEISEALEVDNLYLVAWGIVDLTGIKSFSNLTVLQVNSNRLTTLDISGLTSLTTLDCSKNLLITLDVSELISLTNLNCSYNKLTTLDVWELTSLSDFKCYNNQLTALDVSGLKALTYLSCEENQLAFLDVSGLTSLKTLYCDTNKLKFLDVAGLTSLADFQCYSNQLETLDVSKLISLTTFYCDSNRLTTLDVSGLKLLTDLFCYNNQLTSLNVSGLSALTALRCANNKLTALNTSSLSSLEGIQCANNQLETLDFSGLTSLRIIDCSLNNLYLLNLANNNNTKITYFYSKGNPDLICIRVDDPLWSTANWKNIDPQTIFNKEPCGGHKLTVDNIDAAGYNINNLKMNNLSIAADGSSSTVFTYEGSDQDNVSLIFKEQLTTNTDFYGSFKIIETIDGSNKKFLYNHPTYFSAPNKEFSDPQFKMITLQVKNNVTKKILNEYPIKIVRPSVLMVHGIWSNGKDGFGKMEDTLLTTKMYKPYQILKMNYISDQHNSQSIDKFIIDKDVLKKAAIINNISLEKIDVLGHSNGGLLSRYYIQSGFYKNDINKLITFNTPHSGSQLANLLLDPEYNYIKRKLNIFKNADNGVIEDLTVGGNFINDLNNPLKTKKNYKNIGVHTITSDDFAINHSGTWLGLIIDNILAEDSADLFLQDKVFKSPKHDVVVSEVSQIGGCESTTPFQNQWHLSSTQNKNFKAKTIQLLNENPKNPLYFSLNGFNPKTLDTPFFKKTDKFIKKNTSSESITIVSPIEGATYSPGQEVSIVVNGSAGIEKIVTSMGSTLVTIQNHVDENATSSNFNFQIPIDALGRLEIVSAGYSSTSYENLDSTFITVTTTAILQSVSVEEDFIYIPEGQKTPITILGHYDDGVVRDITSMIGLNYKFDQNNAEITESGLVSGLIEGEDVLTITYLGKKTTVPLTIEKIVNLSSKEFELLAGIFAYPNPAKGMLYLEGDLSELKTLSIYSLTGQQILEIKKDFREINIEALQSGIYLLKISTRETSKYIKIIKE